MNARTITFITLILIVISLVLITTIRLLDYKNWLMPPSRVSYELVQPNINTKLKEKFRFKNFCYDSNGFGFLVHGKALWTICKLPKSFQIKGKENDPKYFQFGMVRIDPTIGRAQVYPFPKQLPHYSTLGLFRGVNNEVGVIYTTGDFDKLVVGLIDRNGWQNSPVVLPNSKKAKFLAVVNLGKKVEVVYHPERFDTPRYKGKKIMPVITTIVNGKLSTRIIPTPIKDCRLEVADKVIWRCIHPCEMFYKNSQWVMQFNQYSLGKKQKQIFEIDESGKSTYIKEGRCFSFLEKDKSSLGHSEASLLIRTGREDAIAISIDGKRTAIKGPAKKSWYVAHANWTEFSPDSKLQGLVHHRVWRYVIDKKDYYARPFADGWLSLAKHYKEGIVYASKLNKQGDPKDWLPLYKDPYSCSSLAMNGVPIMRKDGGFWLVSNFGCYVSVSPDLKPIGTVNIFQHLNTEGSYGRPKYRQSAKLIWIYVGLPLLGLLALIFAKRANKNYLLSFNYSMFVYIVTAGSFLLQLWPYMR